MAKKFLKDYEVEIINRTDSTLFYKIPDLGNLSRTFQPGESKTVTYEEVERLSWTPGGMTMLKEYIKINDPDVARAILPEIEAEYYYTEPEVRALLVSGKLEQLQDALDFAPQGVIEMIKDMAVTLPINDMNKAQAIFEQTGFNVMKAIEHNREAEMDNGTTAKHRRTAPIQAEDAPLQRKNRRYNVIPKEAIEEPKKEDKEAESAE